MNTPSPFKSAYLKFLELVSAVEAMPSIGDVDANEKALFDALCLAWSQGNPFSVRAAINQSNLGSPATLHKRLQQLIAKDLIVAEFEGQDRRTKYLRPSEKGLLYIEWLSSKMTTVQAV
jgi:hypothetical protein